MLNSNPHFFTRIGDTRILCPFAARALDLWFMLQLWSDEHDRAILQAVQRQVRETKAQLGFPQPQFAMLRRVPLQEMVFQMILNRDMLDRQYHARHLFAEAAHRQARQHQISRPYDMHAVYGSLVAEVYPREEDASEKPLALLSYLGGVAVDTRILGARGNNRLLISTIISNEICEAIAKHFPEDVGIAP